MDKQDIQLKELLGKQRQPKAPLDFSKKVMDRIHAEPRYTEYKPVLGKRFLPMFLTAFALFVVYQLIGLGNSSGDGALSALFGELKVAEGGLNELNEGFVGFMNQIPLLLVVVMFAITVLLFVDRYLSRRLQKSL